MPGGRRVRRGGHGRRNAVGRQPATLEEPVRIACHQPSKVWMVNKLALVVAQRPEFRPFLELADAGAGKTCRPKLCTGGSDGGRSRRTDRFLRTRWCSGLPPRPSLGTRSRARASSPVRRSTSRYRQLPPVGRSAMSPPSSASRPSAYGKWSASAKRCLILLHRHGNPLSDAGDANPRFASSATVALTCCSEPPSCSFRFTRGRRPPRFMRPCGAEPSVFEPHEVSSPMCPKPEVGGRLAKWLSSCFPAETRATTGYLIRSSQES